MKNNIKKIISVAILILGPIIEFAQAPSPPPPTFGPGGPVSCNAPAGVPVGNGYWVLLALAFAYGVYSYWHSKRAEKPV